MVMYDSIVRVNSSVMKIADLSKLS